MFARGMRITENLKSKGELKQTGSGSRNKMRRRLAEKMQHLTLGREPFRIDRQKVQVNLQSVVGSQWADEMPQTREHILFAAQGCISRQTSIHNK